MRRRPALLRALDDLKSQALANAPLNDRAFDACRSAPDDVHYAHALYREAGEIAIRHELWETAEEFAIRTLRKMPSSGSALKILAQSLKARQRYREATHCQRYRLPAALRDKYFATTEPLRTDSANSPHVRRLPASPGGVHALNPPLTLDEQIPVELTQTSLDAAEAFTLVCQDAQLWFDGFNTTVWDADGLLIEDSCRGMPEVVNEARHSRPISQLNGRACLLGNRNSANYYHWMNDILPRLHVLQMSGVSIDSIDHYIVNSLEHDFQYETLQRFGIDESRLVTIDPQVRFSCPTLYLANYGSNTLGKGQDAWNPAFLAGAFLDPALAKSQANRQRLFISRPASKGRALLNETALLPLLEDRGFRRITLEGLSVAAQARLFASAEAVISAHGAALTNIVFCSQGSTIIELYQDHILPCYWLISELTGLRHAVLQGDKQACVSDDVHSLHYHESADRRRLSNFRIDPGRVAALLDQLGLD